MAAIDLIKEWDSDGVTWLEKEQASRLLGELGLALNPSTRRAGIELRIALELDPIFGPVVAFSYGRMAMDVWDDVTYRVVPLTTKDARVMVREPKAAGRLLGGYGSAKAPDVSGIEAAILKLSQLAEAAPELVELALDPVYAYPDGLVVKAATIRLAGAKP
ncbi:MAG: acetate--CoA ligase family protein [Chloroflexi bacterium]|nr:acetate--CoA ligase family protein [Chloroflexota bacterium]